MKVTQVVWPKATPLRVFGKHSNVPHRASQWPAFVSLVGPKPTCSASEPIPVKPGAQIRPAGTSTILNHVARCLGIILCWAVRVTIFAPAFAGWSLAVGFGFVLGVVLRKLVPNQ